GQLDLPVGGVERDRARLEPPLEIEVVDALLAQYHLLGLPVAAQELLRQWRAVVRQVRFRADRDDATVESLAPQRLRRAQTGERGPDDRHGPHSRSNLPTGRNPDVAVILTPARPPPVEPLHVEEVADPSPAVAE